MKITYVNYAGPSMRPTFKPGDELGIEPYGDGRDVRRGDVVLFSHPRHSYDVVHRTIRIVGVFVETRGDNSREADPFLVRIEDLHGRVATKKRGRRNTPVPGGWRGVLLHYVCRLRNSTRRNIARLAFPAYRRLADTGWFYGRLDRFIHISHVTFRRREGLEHRLVWRKRSIALRKAGEQNWQVKFPLRLFIDFSQFG